MMLDDFAADWQAEPGALRLVRQGVADLLEALEDLGLIRRRNAETGIDDADDERRRRAATARHVTEPASVNLTAFEIRLMTTWIKRSRSPVITGRSGATSLIRRQALLLEE